MEAHTLFGSPFVGYTLTGGEISENNIILRFAGFMDTVKEMSVTVADYLDKKKILTGINKLAVVEYLEDGNIDQSASHDYYIAKIYNGNTDTTYHKIVNVMDLFFSASKNECILACVPIPDTLYIEAKILVSVNSIIDDQFSYSITVN